MEKVCTKCGVLKDESEFSAQRDKRRANCKACQAAYKREYLDRTRPDRRPYVLHATDESRKESARESVRMWKQRNPEKALAMRRVAKRNRKVKLRGNIGRHTHKQVQELHAKQKYRCAICKCDTSKDRHVDHIVPLAAGGTNYIENLQILCPTCNIEKSAKDPVLFMQEKGFLL
jgi:5-methylcytosine-specific restriction endonuclease McrA